MAHGHGFSPLTLSVAVSHVVVGVDIESARTTVVEGLGGGIRNRGRVAPRKRLSTMDLLHCWAEKEAVLKPLGIGTLQEPADRGCSGSCAPHSCE